jgi:hypothetical protein
VDSRKDLQGKSDASAKKTRKRSIRRSVIVRSTSRIAVKSGKKITHLSKKSTVKSVRLVKKSVVKVHYQIAKRPHSYMKSNWLWYARWHAWPKHRVVHYAGVGVYSLMIGLVVFSSMRTALAADLNNNWNFSSPSDFSFDSGIEASGSSARLKAQEYGSDANTAALYHLNESSGTSVSDSSSNGNTATTSGSPSFGGGVMNNSLSLNGTNQNASAPDSASLSVTGQQSLEAWIKPSSTFNSSSSQSQTILDKGSYKLGLDRTTGKVTYEIQNSNSEQWTKRLGDGQSGGWDFNHGTIESSVAYGTDIYVGIGNVAGDAEVWKWNGSSWSKVGGDGLNSSWNTNYETVQSLAVNGTALYAGLGTGAGDGEVWGCELASGCSTWTKLGGDGIGITAGTSVINVMHVFGGSLYVGSGGSAGNGDVFRYNGGTSWTQVAGDGLNSSWAASTYESVLSLTSDGTSLFAGIGTTTTDAEVWRFTSGAWTQIGGDGINTSWNTNYETVESLTTFGGNLYAGLGNTSGVNDGEVWRYNGTSWSQIGGDGINSSWSAVQYNQVLALTNDGTNLYAGTGQGTNSGRAWKFNGSTWTEIGGNGVANTFIAFFARTMLYTNSKLYLGISTASSAANNNGSSFWEYDGSSWTVLGGGYINNSWGGYNIGRVVSSTSHNGKMYYGLGSAPGNAVVYEYDGTTATIIGGSSLRGSWPHWSYEEVTTMTSYNGDLYVGLGTSVGKGEVWKYNGSTWSKVGGGSLNSSWSSVRAVSSMAVYDSKLYVTLGSTINANTSLYSFNGSTWTLVKNTWSPTTFSYLQSLTVWNGQLCVAGGYGGGGGSIFCGDGNNSWTLVGGGNTNGSWDTASFALLNLGVFKGNLIASYQSGNNSDTRFATVWEYNGSLWNKIGGDGVNASWPDQSYKYAGSMAVYNGELYVGTGGISTGAAADVWRYNGTTWSQVGGSGVNNSWTFANSIEEVGTMSVYKGKLYAGIGRSSNSDAMVYSFGNNAYLDSTQSTFGSNWSHIAAKYDGISMKLFINGVEDKSVNLSATGVDNSSPLLIGTGYGSPQNGDGQQYFNGLIDEVRISNTARTSFTSKPYPMTPQAVRLSNAARKSGVESWNGLSSSETTNGGAITYRLSDNEGGTWKYWTGSEWSASSSYTDSNSIGIINSNIATFPVTFSGIMWQAVLSGNGDQQVTLNSVSLSANSDVVVPDTNATNIVASKSNGGASLTGNAWTNGASPYFSWDAGSDTGSGVSGYCLYLGQTSSSDPVTTKGLLGTSPVDTNGRCQFTVNTTNFDGATAGYIATALSSSNDPYYLNIKAIDNAGNVYDNSEQFQFRFDNTAPSNPGFISAPSGFINTKSATITWPTVGVQAPSDSNSGILGLQYKFNSGSWYGDNHIGTGDSSDLLVNDGSYTTTDPDPPDSNDIVDGINTIYIRTWDQAGNVTTSYTTAALKVNTSGAPTEPQNVVATPSTNTSNSFAFSWAAPATFVGNGNNITYCYTINTLPNANNCSFTVAGDTDLAAGPYATQPGANTFYVVAKDESSNINYSSFSSVSFTANTPAPGLAINMDIVDVSIKSTSNWRLAITWDQPEQVGAGISAYRIYRSIDNATFSLVGSSSSSSFVDTGLSQQTYYYKVRACDSANNCSADSAIVSLLPTGKFTSPAVITSEPASSEITTRRAKITWSTDRNSDSKISIGTKSGEYSPSEVGNSSQVTSHVIDLDNLAAGTTYYYIAKWTDVDGNTGQSQEYTFTTSPAPILKEVNTLSINLSSATLQFTVKDATKVELQYGKNDSFGGVKSLNTSRNESTYELEVNGLDDGTKYLYKISMYDSEGGKYQSSIFSFTTPPRPKISNLRFQPITGESTSTQQVTWNTNIPTNSIVSYGKVTTTGTVTQTQELKTAHEITIKGLEDNSEYFLIAQGRDSNGNIAVSDRQVFKTALDTRAPLISDIVIEPTIRGTGAEARGQIVVSWRTDEPSTSQVAFAEGSSAQVFNNRTAEDAQLTTEHLVIISDLAPSKVYSIKPISKDKSGNASLVTAQSAIVGRASDSVLNIVLNTLRKVFGL